MSEAVDYARYLVEQGNTVVGIQLVRELLAHIDAGRAAVIEELAEAAEDTINSGDVAEVAAPSGITETGRAACVAARDRLYEDPPGWLRDQADTPDLPASGS